MNEEHGIEEAYMRALTNGEDEECVLECACGYQAVGYSWEDAGSELDEHLENEE